MAIKKYSWENFEHKILQNDLTQKEAKDLEIKYIKNFNTISPNGYNITKGGDTNYKKGSIMCIETSEVFSDVEDLLIKQNNLLHNKYNEKDIIDCCELNREYITIPWRNLKYHYQYYTKNIITDIRYITRKI